MIAIQLEKMQFHAFHGLYEEEQKIGQIFELDVSLKAHVNGPIMNLSDTVDYVAIFQIIQHEMNKATPLLENLCSTIADAIAASDKRIGEISIAIKKLHPPIPGFTGQISVGCNKKYGS